MLYGLRIYIESLLKTQYVEFNTLIFQCNLSEFNFLQCPDEFQTKVSRTGMDDYEEYNNENTTHSVGTTEKTLVALHR